jgi:hypothetical protein
LVYRYEFVDGPFDVVVTTSGEASLDEFMAGDRRLLSDPRQRGGLNLLYDHSALDLSTWRGKDVREVAAADRLVDEHLWAARIAIVAPADLSFGFSRMWQGLIGTAAQEHVTVVRSVPEAYEWLARNSE